MTTIFQSNSNASARCKTRAQFAVAAICCTLAPRQNSAFYSLLHPGLLTGRIMHRGSDWVRCDPARPVRVENLPTRPDPTQTVRFQTHFLTPPDSAHEIFQNLLSQPPGRVVTRESPGSFCRCTWASNRLTPSPSGHPLLRKNH